MNSATPGETVPALVRLLDEAQAWRARAAAAIEADLDALAAEERVAVRLLEEAQRRHGAIAALRREEQQRVALLDDALLGRKREAVASALGIDRSRLEERAQRLAAEVTRHEAELAAWLEAPENAAVLDLWAEARARAAEAGDTHVFGWLDAANRARVESVLAEVGRWPTVDAPPLAVGVLVSAEPPVGAPEAFVLVLPVPWAVYAEGTARAEDLCARLAYRLVACVYRFLAEHGAAGAPVGFVELDGSLAVQVWLGEHPVSEEARDRLLEAIAAAVDGADELDAAGVEVFAMFVTPDLIAGVAS